MTNRGNFIWRLLIILVFLFPGMSALQPDIIQQLRQEILLRQGFRPPTAAAVDMGLGPVEAAFPHGVFPTGAMHEVIVAGAEGMAAGSGFLAALIGPLMRRGGAVIWVGGERRVFPPGLAAFGVDAEKVIFLSVRKEARALWAMEEALKCEGLAAVVGEVREIAGIPSRRLQLAVEQSRVTGFLLRESPRNGNPIAAVARWRVSAEAGGRPDENGLEVPGVGFARWKVELSRIRNGRPGNWVMEWRAGRFHPVLPEEAAAPERAGVIEARRQTG